MTKRNVFQDLAKIMLNLFRLTNPENCKTSDELIFQQVESYKRLNIYI